MNILILQASPRANGNTAWMADEYKKAAEAAGHEVTLVNVSRKKIAGCLACEYCHNKGNGACIQKDDMQELYPLMNEQKCWYWLRPSTISRSAPRFRLLSNVCTVSTSPLT